MSIRHKDLKKFADPKLESRHMEGIIERFNLYKYKQEGVAYRGKRPGSQEYFFPDIPESADRAGRG